MFEISHTSRTWWPPDMNLVEFGSRSITLSLSSMSIELRQQIVCFWFILLRLRRVSSCCLIFFSHLMADRLVWDWRGCTIGHQRFADNGSQETSHCPTWVNLLFVQRKKGFKLQEISMVYCLVLRPGSWSLARSDLKSLVKVKGANPPKSLSQIAPRDHGLVWGLGVKTPHTRNTLEVIFLNFNYSSSFKVSLYCLGSLYNMVFLSWLHLFFVAFYHHQPYAYFYF